MLFNPATQPVHFPGAFHFHNLAGPTKDNLELSAHYLDIGNFCHDIIYTYSPTAVLHKRIDKFGAFFDRHVNLAVCTEYINGSLKCCLIKFCFHFEKCLRILLCLPLGKNSTL